MLLNYSPYQLYLSIILLTVMQLNHNYNYNLKFYLQYSSYKYNLKLCCFPIIPWGFIITNEKVWKWVWLQIYCDPKPSNHELNKCMSLSILTEFMTKMHFLALILGHAQGEGKPLLLLWTGTEWSGRKSFLTQLSSRSNL